MDADLQTVLELKELSAVHYDFECKRIGSELGLLSIWQRMLEIRKEAPKDYWPDGYVPEATFRDLDTLCKVCEHGAMFFLNHKRPDAADRIAKFVKQVGNALRTSHEFTKLWTHDFEELK